MEMVVVVAAVEGLCQPKGRQLNDSSAAHRFSFPIFGAFRIRCMFKSTDHHCSHFGSRYAMGCCRPAGLYSCAPTVPTLYRCRISCTFHKDRTFYIQRSTMSVHQPGCYVSAMSVQTVPIFEEKLPMGFEPMTSRLLNGCSAN